MASCQTAPIRKSRVPLRGGKPKNKRVTGYRQIYFLK